MPAVLIVYYIRGAWDASVLLDFYLLVFRHYYNIRQDIDFKTILGYCKVKTVCVYVWIWSYDYPFISKRFRTLKSWLDDLPILLCKFISLWFTRLIWCFVNARVSPGCTGSGYRMLCRDELEKFRRRMLYNYHSAVCCIWGKVIIIVQLCVVLWYCMYF